MWYTGYMTNKIKELMQRVGRWSPHEQAELVEFAERIERRHAGHYHATQEELAAIDEADLSGVATPAQVEEAFRAFHRA